MVDDFERGLEGCYADDSWNASRLSTRKNHLSDEVGGLCNADTDASCLFGLCPPDLDPLREWLHSSLVLCRPSLLHPYFNGDEAGAMRA